MAYPASLDTFAGTTAQGGSLLASVDHALDHRTLGSAAAALESKVGIGSGTPTTGAFFQGTSGGSSFWGTALNNLTLGTPAITGGTVGTASIIGGTANNVILGTPTLILGSDATGDVFFRSAGGTINRLPVGGTGQVLTVSTGTLPSWSTPASQYAVIQAGGTVTTNVSVAGTTYTDVTGGSCTITLTGTANVFIAVNGNWSNDQVHYNQMQLLRGTNILTGIVNYCDTAAVIHNFSLNYMDSQLAPGTYTYKLQMCSDNSAGTVHIFGASFGQKAVIYAMAMA